MFKALSAVSIIAFLSACTGGPYPLSTDPRAKTLQGKTWTLYSDDIIDTNSGKSDYISRVLADSCGTTVTFFEKDTLIQRDSCLHQPSRTVQGHWNWYTGNPFFAELKTDTSDEPIKDLYKFDGDTLQLSVHPFYYTDSMYNRWYLRVKTFVSH